MLSGCSLCGVRLAIAKRKFEKHYFGAIALTEELKSINNVSDNFNIKEILSVFPFTKIPLLS